MIFIRYFWNYFEKLSMIEIKKGRYKGEKLIEIYKLQEIKSYFEY